MGLIKLLAAPVRRFVSFPLVQLAIAIAVILFLQAADSKTLAGQIFNALDSLVDYTVRLCAAIFEVKSFTRSWLVTGFMIAYVYLAALLILFLLKLAIGAVIEMVARRNAFGLRNAVARERGIVAYQAWLPLERIRPAHIPQAQWEEAFAWPPGDKPPYPPLAFRILRAAVVYVAFILIVATLLEVFTPFPALTWIGRGLQSLVGLS